MVTAISGEGLVKNYGRHRVLKGIQFSLGPGQIAVLMGRNGAGKSTFIRIAATLLKMDQGSLFYFGNPLDGNEVNIRRQLGVTLHASMLYSDLTAEENLTFFANLYDLDNVGERLDEVFKIIHMNDQRKQRVRTLSHGMVQRLTLGRAILHHPRILLLDEPFTGLDFDSLQWMEEALVNFRDKGGSVIFVSHDFEHIPDLANSAFILHDGFIVTIDQLSGMTSARLRDEFCSITGSKD